MNETRVPRPVSYGSRERAKSYVESLLANGRQSEPVYLIVSPAVRANAEIWPMLLGRLREILPGIEFRVWQHVSKDADAYTGSRVDYIRDHHGGAILIGFRHFHMIRTGPVALAEATGFAATGKPVLVFTGTRLAAWPDCQVLKIPEEKRRDNRVTAYVLLPLRPVGKPLPTFAASLHMWGITDPEVIANAAGLGNERAPRGPERPSAGSRKPGKNVRIRSSTSPRTRAETR